MKRGIVQATTEFLEAICPEGLVVTELVTDKKLLRARLGLSEKYEIESARLRDSGGEIYWLVIKGPAMPSDIRGLKQATIVYHSNEETGKVWPVIRGVK